MFLCKASWPTTFCKRSTLNIHLYSTHIRTCTIADAPSALWTGVFLLKVTIYNKLVAGRSIQIPHWQDNTLAQKCGGDGKLESNQNVTHKREACANVEGSSVGTSRRCFLQATTKFTSKFAAKPSSSKSNVVGWGWLAKCMKDLLSTAVVAGVAIPAGRWAAGCVCCCNFCRK